MAGGMPGGMMGGQMGGMMGGQNPMMGGMMGGQMGGGMPVRQPCSSIHRLTDQIRSDQPGLPCSSRRSNLPLTPTRAPPSHAATGHDGRHDGRYAVDAARHARHGRGRAGRRRRHGGDARPSGASTPPLSRFCAPCECYLSVLMPPLPSRPTHRR